MHKNFSIIKKEANKCLNVNECKDRFISCPINSLCVDTIGSHKCICAEGFIDSNQSMFKRNLNIFSLKVFKSSKFLCRYNCFRFKKSILRRCQRMRIQFVNMSSIN